jgi:NADH-quinone oxidoreductase subunit L
MNFLQLIWLIPLLPALGAVINGLAGKKMSKKAIDWVACGLVGLAFLLSLAAVLQMVALPTHERHIKVDLFTWIPAGMGELRGGMIAPFSINWGYQLDPLSAVMILVVTGIGLLIHIYSTGYMAHEGGYYRFFAFLNLFMFAMLTLVLASNFAVMFVGWEGVGLCSYLLIGFYFHKKSAADAGKKAFVVNRVGDFGFMLGMFLIFTHFGSLDFSTVFQTANSKIADGTLQVGDGLITTTCLLLFLGACGKSAQIPLYIWLPDAMEGPTPVSALIHAATMVTAGVYMVARCNALFMAAPLAMFVVATVGALTAIFAATIGLVQNDIKKVLAYSTVSQLGYMFLGCGVGAFSAGVFHLMTHAFFKALLFLGAGSVIHAMSGEQDIQKMGALWKKIPTTYWTMLAGTLAIAGCFPLSGFFSKDEILWRAADSPLSHWVIWLMSYSAAGLTAFYMFRLMFLTFHGESRVSPEVEHHIHESPASMTIPLRILAVGAVVAGWVGIPSVFYLSNQFEGFLEPVFETPIRLGEGRWMGWSEVGMMWLLMVLSLSIAAAGAYVAYVFYLKDKAIPDRLAAGFEGVYTTLSNKYWVDEIYDTLFVNRIKGLGTWFARFDLNIIDGGVNGSAWMTRAIASLSNVFDFWVVDFTVRRSDLIYYMSYPFRWLQTGRVQNYAAMAMAGILLLVGFFLFR